VKRKRAPYDPKETSQRKDYSEERSAGNGLMTDVSI